MRTSPFSIASSALAAAALALSAATSALAAFDGDFALVDVDSPAGYYTPASDVSTLGNWSVAFFPAAGGSNFIDTTSAPGAVTLGAQAIPAPESDYDESTTVLVIDLPVDGHVAFTIQVTNSAASDSYPGAEIYLSGVELYTLTQPGGTYQFDFDTSSGETLEFRSAVITSGPPSSATSQATISNFVFTPAAIPEPSAFATFAAIATLGIAARRRQRRV